LAQQQQNSQSSAIHDFFKNQGQPKNNASNNNENLLQQLVQNMPKQTQNQTPNNETNDQIYLKRWLSNGTFITPLTQQQIRNSDNKKPESENIAQEIENLILILSQNCKSDLEKTVIRAAVMSAHGHNMDTRQILHHVQGQLGMIQVLSRESKDLGQFLASLAAMGIGFGQQNNGHNNNSKQNNNQQPTTSTSNAANNPSQVTISAELFNQLTNHKNSSAQMSALAVIQANQQAQQALFEAQKAAENAVVEQVKLQSKSQKNEVNSVQAGNQSQADLINLLQKQNGITKLNKAGQSSKTDSKQGQSSIQIPGTQIHIPNPNSIQATMEFQKARENITAANLIHNTQLRSLQQKINAQLNGSQAICKETLAEQAMHLLQLHKQQEEIESRAQKQQLEQAALSAAQSRMNVNVQQPEKFDLSGLKPEGMELYQRGSNNITMNDQNNIQNPDIKNVFKKQELALNKLEFDKLCTIIRLARQDPKKLDEIIQKMDANTATVLLQVSLEIEKQEQRQAEHATALAQQQLLEQAQQNNNNINRPSSSNQVQNVNQIFEESQKQAVNKQNADYFDKMFGGKNDKK